MSDIHQGFQNVDQAAEAASFLQFLDAAAALPSIQAYRQQMTALCPPNPGQRILDVGCGIGHRTLRLAQRVQAEGSGGGHRQQRPDDCRSTTPRCRM